MRIADRTSSKQNCPVCAKKRVVPGFNDLESNMPDIAAQCDVEANDGLTPSEVYFRSTKKVFRRCDEGHLFDAAIRSRTERGTGYRVSAKQVVEAGINDLATTHHELADEWGHEAHAPLTPTEIVSGSEKSLLQMHKRACLPFNLLREAERVRVHCLLEADCPGWIPRPS